MKIGYFDCFSGISGDMCLGALLDVGVPLEIIREGLASLPLSGYELEAQKVSRAGIAATQAKVVLSDPEPPTHRGLSEVLEIIQAGNLPAVVERKACDVFRALAEAEARVHGTETQSVRFHDVGAVDAICDIAGAVIGLEFLGLDEVLFSTISLGGGTVRGAHGAMPVPAPATAELLRGLPTRGGPVEFELTTPTGAALLRSLGRPSPQWPEMCIEQIGYGAGAREVAEMPNVLRLAVGRTAPGAKTESDCVWALEVNLDDMTGEQVGYCTEKLFGAGALDVYITPIQMKKGRPGIKLSVLCAPEGLSTTEEALWRHTTTLGIRRSLWQRSKLHRRIETIRTKWGEVRVKLAYLGDEMIRCEPEYEDCRRIAESENLPLGEVYKGVRQAREGSR